MQAHDAKRPQRAAMWSHGAPLLHTLLPLPSSLSSLQHARHTEQHLGGVLSGTTMKGGAGSGGSGGGGERGWRAVKHRLQRQADRGVAFITKHTGRRSAQGRRGRAGSFRRLQSCATLRCCPIGRAARFCEPRLQRSPCCCRRPLPPPAAFRCPMPLPPCTPHASLLDHGDGHDEPSRHAASSP